MSFVGFVWVEELHAYETVAWFAEKSGLEVSPRRYRFTGMERDDRLRQGVELELVAHDGRSASADQCSSTSSLKSTPNSGQLRWSGLL